ncbi:Uma2 family endonuclease [Haliscomenobacter sp.]|uniref:Uma2 family endonuclease n=1 Tax=Haliscomenobacter sp. TaxID=2717303 RepID=UPI0035938DE4
MQSSAIKKEKVFYPESDGQPMAENTLQYEWIVLIKQGLESIFLNRDDVFIAADLFWYPVEGENTIRLAPDVLVALGRPKGKRGSYKQWKEANIAPQVVFEILSPSNRPLEMSRKLQFYEQYGVLEYYIYDPENFSFSACVRKDTQSALVDVSEAEWGNCTSPLLGISFYWDGETALEIKDPQGKPFLAYQEWIELQSRAKTMELELEAEKRHAEILAQKLRELGINPDELST